MSPRRKRMQKLVDVRERQLDDKVGVLNRNRAAEEQARMLAEEQQRRCAEAERARAELERAAVTAAEWQEATAWLEQRRLHTEAAKAGARKAELAVRRATAEVLGARQALEQIKRLDDKLAASELDVQLRQERVQDDAFAARKARERSRR